MKRKIYAAYILACLICLTLMPYSVWESNPHLATALILLLATGIAIGISKFFILHAKHNEIRNKDKKIKEVKERLERTISATPVSYSLTVDGIIVELNENMKKDTGVSIGDPILNIYANPNERALLVSHATEAGFLKNEIVKYRFADGKIHRCLLNMTVVDYEDQLAVASWIVDIEEDQIKRDSLQTARQSLQTILDTMPAPIGIVDISSMQVVYGNDAYLKLFGFNSLSNLDGIDICQTLAAVQQDGTDAATLADQIIRSREVAASEIQCRTTNGDTIDIRMLAGPIDYNGRGACIGIMTDLAQEKEYQRMLLSTAEKEKEANLLKSRFLVNMSHEIRTPMNAIIGLTEIELRKNPQGDVKDIYKKINISAKNLLGIINDILDLSKIEADKIELFEDEFELEDVLNSALLVAAPRLDGKSVEFMLNASLNLPRYVVGDRTRLWQILKNFLDNSAKYTENGRIVLTVYPDPAHSSSDTIAITFVVEDTGIGIDEKQMLKLFEPYEQIYSEAQRKYSGTGLGMPISKQLCEIMGGSLQVESKPDKGTTIRFQIPFKRSTNNATELGVKSILSGADILAVDDDNISLGIMRQLLEGSGANFMLAQSGLEAMDIILNRRDEGKAFDLILLDYMMEGLNGLETARQIHLSLSKVPKLLMVTSYQKLLLKSDLEKNGIEDIIEKPFIPSQFIRKLSEILSGESASSDTAEKFLTYDGACVLLCEDYRLNQEVAIGMFAQFGIAPTIAENGQECIEILNSGKAFDLIFMDLQMPVMNGYETTRIIRSNSKFDHIPIISLTADAIKEIVDNCLEIGMNDHVSKPIEFDSLNRVFQKWLPKSKRMYEKDAHAPAYDAFDLGLARFGGDEERYENALIEFAQMLPDEWPSLNDLLEKGEETKKYLHKLKGASGNLALNDIYRHAADFENSLRNSSPDIGTYEHLIGASNAFKELANEKAKHLGATPLRAGTPEEFNAYVKTLRSSLEGYDPKGSSSAVSSLKSKSWPFLDERKLQRIYNLAQKYEFDDALDALDSLIGEAE